MLSLVVHISITDSKDRVIFIYETTHFIISEKCNVLLKQQINVQLVAYFKTI